MGISTNKLSSVSLTSCLSSFSSLLLLPPTNLCLDFFFVIFLPYFALLLLLFVRIYDFFRPVTVGSSDDFVSFRSPRVSYESYTRKEIETELLYRKQRETILESVVIIYFFKHKQRPVLLLRLPCCIFSSQLVLFTFNTYFSQRI